VSLCAQLGGSIVSTTVITLFDRRTYFHSDTLRGAITLAHPLVREFVAAPAGTLRLASLVRQQAESAGFADAILCLVPISICAITFALMLRRAKPPAAAAARPAQ
jgi:hypothetical protein